MENWSKDFSEMVNMMAEAVEEFLQDVSQAIEEIAEQVQMEITSESEYWFEEFDNPRPTPTSYQEIEDLFAEPFLDDSELFVNPKLEPNAETHPACIGCRHYHGRIYSGNLLICAMHPYGWDDRNCPDWENC